uniref:Putative Na+ channel toxin n=1 Tax=Superstitionia donensis TaxID=311983 RepID=A0A1V1WBP9_9SCOR
MKSVVLSIIWVLVLLLQDTVVLQKYDGYLYHKNGSYYQCYRATVSNCPSVCHKYGAYGGECHGTPAGCFCKGLEIKKHGGYPMENGEYVWCGGDDEMCDDVCKRQEAESGYCYSSRYCWCVPP